MKDIECFYKILGYSFYNSERRPLFDFLIKKFLTLDSDAIDIKKEISIFKEDSMKDLLSDYFKHFDYIITSGLDYKEIKEYIELRYSSFEELFKKNYGIPLSVFTDICFTILVYLDFKIKNNPYDFPVYEFENKEDYANRKFVAYPSEDYIEKYKEIFTVDIKEFKEVLPSNLNKYLDKFIDLYSISIDDIKSIKEFRIKEYPLIKWGDKLIFIDSTLYIKYLPHKIHILLSKCKSYNSKKGKIFENIALNLIESFPFIRIESKNIKYDDYELDALINFRRSTWFVECKSRNIDRKSLLGSIKDVHKDIERIIKKSIKQGERAIDNENHPSISKYKLNIIKGILIITEGIFPTVQLPSFLYENPTDNSKYPICILNYFELKKILKQPDVHRFEDFIIWRSQKKMPILCFDALDYWAFYNDNYRRNKEMKKAFEECKRKEITKIYISQRFNKKDYLNKLKEES